MRILSFVLLGLVSVVYAAPNNDVMLEGKVPGPERTFGQIGKTKMQAICQEFETQGKFKCKRTWDTGAAGELLNGNSEEWLPDELKRVVKTLKLDELGKVQWSVADDAFLGNDIGERVPLNRVARFGQSWFSRDMPLQLFSKAKKGRSRQPRSRKLQDKNGTQAISTDAPSLTIQHNAPPALGSLSAYAGAACTTRCNDPDRFFYTAEGQGVTIYIVDGHVADHEQFRDMETGDSRISEDRHYSESAEANIGEVCASDHGTHVAALAGGFEYGAGKDATIVSVAVQPGCNGRGRASELAEGLSWILERYLALPEPRPPSVVSMSLLLSGHSQNGRIIGDIVEDMISAGLIVVAAAGNLHQDACDYVPAGLPDVITVAAADVTHDAAVAYPWSWSNFGPCVDLWAPGVDVLSASPDCFECEAVFSGTSQAAPLVSGLVAQLLEEQPTLTAAGVKRELSQHAAKSFLEKLMGRQYAETTNLFAQTDLSAETDVTFVD